ncbi:MAG: hypothetical protein QG595_496 [Pseudomonadota bacterium]|jgi:hypothetical protein|nr:hypothetical protein [Pseudomonadota bacterium]
MWSSGFSFGLRVNRHCCLTAAVVAVTLAAFLAIWLSALPRVCALPLGIIAGLQGWRALRAGYAAVAITVDVAGRIRTDGQGDTELRLTGQSWILPGVAAGFRLADCDGRIVPIILFRCQLSAETWRRLLVCIRGN